MYSELPLHNKLQISDLKQATAAVKTRTVRILTLNVARSHHRLQRDMENVQKGMETTCDA